MTFYCPHCNHVDLEIVLARAGQSCECRRCGHVWVKPSPIEMGIHGMTAHSGHAADLACIAEDRAANPCSLTDDVARNVSTTLRSMAKPLESHGDEIKRVLCETLVEKAGFDVSYPVSLGPCQHRGCRQPSNMRVEGPDGTVTLALCLKHVQEWNMRRKGAQAR